jgi:hypothetical protein
MVRAPNDGRSALTDQLRALGMLRDAFALILLGAALVYTNPRFTFLDDETLTLNAATRPITATWRLFSSGMTQHQYPPLYDLLLHLWLRATGGAFDWLRVPAIVFLLMGIWLLSRAARRMGGDDSGSAIIWIGVLWPYGFHFGRLAGWYSFAFLLACALILAYLRCLASPRRTEWVVLLAVGFALIYTNYFGWALLAILGFDYWLRNRGKQPVLGRLLGAAVILAVAYAPLWPAFVNELTRGVHLRQPLTRMVLSAGYDTYVLFLSESMAPWFWSFGVPATIAVAACLLTLFLSLRGAAQRFLVYGALLIAGMAAMGIVQTTWLFLVAPWFLLPLAVALGTNAKWQWRGPLAVSLAIIAGIGWYGTVYRRYYAAPSFIEPWAQIADQAAESARQGAGIISNGPSFFFYLTYALKAPQSNSPWHFTGVLPVDVTYPQVWAPGQWEAAGRPAPSSVLWVRAMGWPAQAQQMDDASQWLNRHCGDRLSRYQVRDPGYAWKERFFPELGATPWRIEIRQYSCGEPSAVPSNPGTAPSP